MLGSPAGRAEPSLLQGRKGDFRLSFSGSVGFSSFTSLFSCSRSRRASNLNLFLGARHIGDRELLLLDTGEEDEEEEEDLEVGDGGLGDLEL